MNSFLSAWFLFALMSYEFQFQRSRSPVEELSTYKSAKSEVPRSMLIGVQLVMLITNRTDWFWPAEGVAEGEFLIRTTPGCFLFTQSKQFQHLHQAFHKVLFMAILLQSRLFPFNFVLCSPAMKSGKSYQSVHLTVNEECFQNCFRHNVSLSLRNSLLSPN